MRLMALGAFSLAVNATKSLLFLAGLSAPYGARCFLTQVTMLTYDETIDLS